MKVTYKWLKDYVDIKVSPEKLAHFLTMAGLEVTTFEKRDGDAIFEMEITPNRADCLSIIGIAREVAAVTGKRLTLPGSYQYIHVKKIHSPLPISIDIRAKKPCPRYSGRIVERVNVKDSPQWMQDKIRYMGLRPINNIVDITNFCLLETGQPMHAFDYDKIKGSKVIVRLAEKGEKLTTIDGVERALSSEMLIIADEEKPIAIAGVMGGLQTEVGPSTKNILLESAYFDPISVRRASRKLGLSSESSYRFERGVDLEAVVAASNRAAVLVNEIAGGTISTLVDSGEKELKAVNIAYDVERASRLLGVNIAGSAAKAIFKALGLEVIDFKNKLKVRIPSFRPDLKEEIDLVEEVARLHGYENIPATIPAMVPQQRRKDFSRIVQEEIRKTLNSSGLTEIITYSLISKELLKKLSLEETNIVDIVNPLSVEQEIMRPTIILGLLNTVLWNLNRKIGNLHLFELGNIYFKDKKEFKEKLTLAIALTGDATGDWRKKRKVNFFDAKGVIEALFYKLGIKDFIFSKEKIPSFLSGEAASIRMGDKEVGVVGKLGCSALSNFDIGQDIYIAEVDIEALLPFARLEKSFEPIPKFPSVKRDVSIILDKGIPSGEIIAHVKEMKISSIAEVELFDEYYGKQIPQGKRGLSFSITYQDRNKTLTDSEVDKAHSKVKEILTNKFSVQFR